MGIPPYSAPGFSCENPYWTQQPHWLQTHYPIMTEVIEDIHSLAPSSPQSDNDSTHSSNLSDGQTSEHSSNNYYATFKIQTNESDNEFDRSHDFKCRWKNCQSALATLNSLSNHVATAHSDASGGLFYCGWEGCSRGNKGFNARYKMLVHVRTHTNEKPHKCNQCEKSFSRAENLKIHTRSHSGEKPYICPVEGCNKAYSNSSDRFKHTRTHAVDKPYCCKIPGCQKRYTDPSSLRKHVKTYKHVASPVVTNLREIEVSNDRVTMPETDGRCGKRKYSYSENDMYVVKSGLNKRQATSSVNFESNFLIDTKMECREGQIGNMSHQFEYQYSEEPLNLKRYSDDDVYENGVLNLGKKDEKSEYFIDHTLGDIPLDLSLRKSFS